MTTNVLEKVETTTNLERTQNLLNQISKLLTKLDKKSSDKLNTFSYALYVATGNEPKEAFCNSSVDYSSSYFNRRLVFVENEEQVIQTLENFRNQCQIQIATGIKKVWTPYICFANESKSNISSEVVELINGFNDTATRIQEIRANQYSRQLSDESNRNFAGARTIDGNAYLAESLSLKQNYVNARNRWLTQNQDKEKNLIPEPKTELVSWNQIENVTTFDQLQGITGITKETIWLKGCNDAGGENIGRFTRKDFDRQWQLFKAEMQEKSEIQGVKNKEMLYLAQASVEFSKDQELEGLCLNFDLPKGFDPKVPYKLSNVLTTVNSQVYADKSKKTFCGTKVDNEYTAMIINQFGSQIKATLEMLWDIGCRGNFIYDVMAVVKQDRSIASINSIADLAQRSSGSSRAIGNLRALESNKVLSLNKFVNIELEELTRLLGNNIFDNNTKKGCLPTPRSSGWFDLSFFGMEQDEIDTIIDNLTNYVNQNPNNSQIKTVYF